MSADVPKIDLSPAVTNEDCMAMMARYPDKYFDLAVVDPPYGIGASRQSLSTSLRKRRNGSPIKRGSLDSKEWDNEIPSEDYFLEVQRVSVNQIIWGGNYFTQYLKPTNGWIVWNKLQLLETRSDGEMAWTSFERPLKIVPLLHDGFKRAQSVGYDKPIIFNVPHSGKQTIHPTQKPVALYSWIFERYAKQGMKILDTHLGSQSSRIAAHKAGLDFWGTELDKDYFDQGNARFNKYLGLDGMFKENHFE